MEDFCKTKGIVYQTTAPGTSDQNPFVERKWLTIMNSVRAVLFHAGLPIFFWQQAAMYVVYIQNRTPVKTNDWVTPIRILGE
jgi:hypothetical protein